MDSLKTPQQSLYIPIGFFEAVTNFFKLFQGPKLLHESMTLIADITYYVTYLKNLKILRPSDSSSSSLPLLYLFISSLIFSSNVEDEDVSFLYCKPPQIVCSFRLSPLHFILSGLTVF